jgi:hypothetical protein
MPVFCEKCHCEIPAYDHKNREKEDKKLVEKICGLSFSNFREREASGGRRYSAKIGTKHEACLFIDTGNNARIMIEGKGRPWLASVDFKDMEDGELFETLKEILRGTL